MPHECTHCGKQFSAGSTEMLSGCPTCEGNRFQFIPAGALESTESEPAERDMSMIEAEPDPDYDPSQSTWFSGEDRAQSDARSGMVDPRQLPKHVAEDDRTGSADTPDAEDASDTRPDLDALREELEDRFGSIKIVDRGEYELNLMELYERRECIIELQENGRYAIQIPEAMANAESPANDVPNR